MADYTRWNRISKFPDAPDRFEVTVGAVYKAVLKPDDVAIDAGAHTGKHTIPMARAVGPGGRVYAFEPIAEKYCALVRNISTTPDASIFAYNACVGDVSGVTSFTYLPDDPGKSAISVRRNIEASPSIEKSNRSVPIIILDETIPTQETIKFIKIDVEGAELSVLRGAKALIERSKPVIHFEAGETPLTAHGVSPIELFFFFKSIKYDVVDIIGNPLNTSHDFELAIESGKVYDFFGCPPAMSELVSRAASAVWES